MDIARFTSSPLGSLIPITGTDGGTGETYSHFAYAAHPLAGPPDLSTDAWTKVAAASRALGRLQQGSHIISNPGLLRRPTLRREAQSTSALEGTYAPLEEVLAADIIATENRSGALSEVMNYVTAAELGFDSIASGRAITSGLLCELHKVLVRGTSADTEEAGRVRRLQVVIGSRSGSIYDARFIPMPDGPALEAAIGDLVTWLAPGGHTGLDPIVAAAMAHYQFETLHPFNDGNGRIGRLLIVLQLVKDHVLEEGLLSVSPWFEQRRDEYQDLLAHVSATGDWSPWVGFFAQGIESSAIDTAHRIEGLVSLQQSFHDQIRNANYRGLIRDVAGILIGTPYVSIPNLRDITGATYQAANVIVQRLVTLGILEQVPGSGTMIFRAPAVIRVLSAPTPRIAP